MSVGSEILRNLDERLKLGRPDKQVISAFLDKKKKSGTKLSTDGKTLDGLWMGGAGIATWEDGKIVFHDLGSKSAQTVQKAIQKEAPKNWLAEGVRETTEKETRKIAKELRPKIVKEFEAALWKLVRPYNVRLDARIEDILGANWSGSKSKAFFDVLAKDVASSIVGGQYKEKMKSKFQEGLDERYGEYKDSETVCKDVADIAEALNGSLKGLANYKDLDGKGRQAKRLKKAMEGVSNAMSMYGHEILPKLK
jgi:hypothetical protein